MPRYFVNYEVQSEGSNEAASVRALLQKFHAKQVLGNTWTFRRRGATAKSLCAHFEAALSENVQVVVSEVSDWASNTDY